MHDSASETLRRRLGDHLQCLHNPDYCSNFTKNHEQNQASVSAVSGMDYASVFWSPQRISSPPCQFKQQYSSESLIKSPLLNFGASHCAQSTYNNPLGNLPQAFGITHKNDGSHTVTVLIESYAARLIASLPGPGAAPLPEPFDQGMRCAAAGLATTSPHAPTASSHGLPLPSAWIQPGPSRAPLR